LRYFLILLKIGATTRVLVGGCPPNIAGAQNGGGPPGRILLERPKKCFKGDKRSPRILPPQKVPLISAITPKRVEIRLGNRPQGKEKISFSGVEKKPVHTKGE